MCGRYACRRDKEKIAKAFRAGKVFDEPMTPDYNIAPTTFQPVIRQERDSEEREMVLLRWGLVPFFAKSLAECKGMSTINAKAETMQSSATWRAPFKSRRCLVPADAFYEWKAVGDANGDARRDAKKGKKQPFVISLKSGEPMAFAGLWDAWKEPKPAKESVHTPDTWLQSYAIITTEANELMAAIHTRMPVILYERDWARWLDRGETERPPVDLLRPYDSDLMEMRPCNPAVGNVKNNGPEMLVCPTSDEPLAVLNSA